MRSHIDKNEEDILVNRHPGATAEEIAYYSKLTLSKIRPDKVIIFAGSNDISRMYYNTKSVDEYEVVKHILDIARNARSTGAKTIYVSSVLPRSGYEFKNIIKRVNSLLNSSCHYEGFHFLEHSDITKQHLGYDGLHCNKYGYTIIKMNILRCFSTFNPFLCDFIDFYDDCLFC